MSYPPWRTLGAVLVLSAALPLCGQTFTDQATALGWPNSNDATRGLGWADYDGDGDFDVYLQNQGSNSRLLRNDGGVFVNQTLPMLVSHASSGWSCAWGDYDNDGKPDLYLGNFAGNNLFRNNFPGAFQDVSPTNGTGDNTFAQSVLWVDHDRDGDLDLYLTKEFDPHRFFQNQGDGNFVDITAQTGLGDVQSHSYGVSFGDFDQDSDPDIFVSTCGAGTINRLFRNNQANGGGLAYTEIAAAAGVNYTPNTYGAEWVDLDDDGDLDLFVVGASGEPNHLYRNDGVLPMVDIALAAGVAGPLAAGHGCDSGDIDNDGRIDLFVHDRSGPSRWYRNLGNLQFVDVPSANGAANPTGGGYDCALVDYDNDGDLDIHVATDSRDRLYRSSGNTNHWLQVVPVGTKDNRAGIGARIEIQVGNQTQYRTFQNSAGAFSQNLLPAHFGLGSATVVNVLRIRWLDGTVDTITNLPADQRVVFQQTSGVAATYLAGLGCPNGSGLAPTLTSVALPVLGSPAFALIVDNVAPFSLVSIWIAAGFSSPAIDLGNNCYLQLDLTSALAFQQAGLNPLFAGNANPGGVFGGQLPIPDDYRLAGLILPVQAIVFDTTAPPLPGSGLNLTVSDTLALQLGY